MVEYSKEVEALFNKGWSLSDTGFSLIKETKTSLSKILTIPVSKFANQEIKAFDVFNNEVIVRGRRKLKGHIEGYPNSIFVYDKKHNPITILKGKVISLRKAFGTEMLDVATHIQIKDIMREIKRKEDRVELTSIPNILEDGFVDVEVFYFERLKEEKELYLSFTYVYTFTSTTDKNPTKRLLETHWSVTIKYSEWEAFKEMTGTLEYGKLSEIVEGWLYSKDYGFVYEITNVSTPIEAITEHTIKLKPKRFVSNIHTYDDNKKSDTIQSNNKTLPDSWWGYEISDIVAYMITGGE